MISRDTANLRTVAAHDNTSFDASCGSLNSATSTLHGGRIIDRTGLGRQYTSALVHVHGTGDIGTSTDSDSKFMGVGAFLYHSSTTCADDFDRYSTDYEQSVQPLFVTSNTTSTLASGYMATSTDVGTFGVFSATATGGASGDYWASYEITGAQRYLRVFPIVQAFASSSGGSVVRVHSDLVFGTADEAPPTTTSTTPAYKTT